MLPKLPYTNSKAEIETVAFRGLNLTENTREGDISSSYGITLDSYPCIKTGCEKSILNGYIDPVDFFEFDGHLAVVDKNFLYLDGEKLSSVSNERKQWTVVNREIVLFPDKLKINVDTGVWGPMNTRTESSGELTFKEGTLTATVDPSYQSGYKQNLTGAKTLDSMLNNNYLYVYRGIGRTDFKEALKNNSLLAKEEFLIIADAIENRVRPGDFFVPHVDGGSFSVDVYNSTTNMQHPHELSNKNFFCVVTKADLGAFDAGGVVNYQQLIQYDVCRVDEGSAKFSEKFAVGQTVSVSLDGGVLLAEKTKITQISDSPNSIIFKDVFSPHFHVEVSTVPQNVTGYHFKPSGVRGYYAFTPSEQVKKGCHIVVENFVTDFSVSASGKLFVYDPDFDTYKYYECNYSPSTPQDENKIIITTKDLKIILERAVPDLDFITERENRLWGVCNANRTVYASALGDPAEFWQYDGVSTDSYAVAIGSEGEFTGICSHNSATVIFKEKQIFKILGSYPEEYCRLDYQMTGLQKGCERSLCIVNETLFYKGRGGIYALGSSTPQLISYPLSSRPYSSAVAAYDGRSYVVYLQKEDSTGGVYSYDLMHGIWAQTDNLQKKRVLAISVVGDALHYLFERDETDAGIIKQYHEIYKETPETSGEWMCEFTLTDEGTFYGKIYTKLYISAELEENSNLEVWIRVDGEEYKKVFEKTVAAKTPLTIPLLLPRAHKFQLKLSGKGAALIRRISREVHVGGCK